MDKIQELLDKIEGNLPQSIERKIVAVNKLHAKYNQALEELNKDPEDDELKEAVSDINDFIEAEEEELYEALQSHLRKQNQLKPAGEPKPEGEPKPSGEQPKEKKKSGFFGVVLGLGILALTAGAVNILNKK